MKNLFILTLVLFALACATQKSYDRDKENPRYYEGMGIPLSDHVKIQPGSKSKMKTDPSQVNTKSVALEHLVHAGATWAMYPDYYHKSTISGTCMIQLENHPLAKAPCRNAEVVLIDSNEKVLGQTSLNNKGEFAFWVKKDKLYYLKVKTMGNLRDKKWGPYSRSDQVALIMK